jgi:stage IV sporulation protein FB
MLGEPAPTPGDLHFRVAGFPVRVHPLFWVVSLVLGMGTGKADPIVTLLWVAVVFVSILVHELGHAVMQRKYGGWPRIVLYGMGGLAICDNCDRTPRSQIIISFAGPAAGFLLAAAIVLLLRISSSDTTVVPFWMEPSAELQQLDNDGKVLPADLLIGTVWFPRFNSWIASVLVSMLLYVNVFWGLVNLLPVYPLDGGRISRELFTLGPHSTGDGIIRSLQLSIAVAVAVAVLALVWMREPFMAFLFGFLAYDSYRALQGYTGRGPGYGWG